MTFRPNSQRNDALEEAAKLVEEMVPVTQPAYLPGTGNDWKAYRQPWEAAAAIRALKGQP